jgi:hypothetical protein
MSQRARLLTDCLQLDKLVGLGMLVAASVVFLYYTIWTLIMVGYEFVHTIEIDC